MMMIRPATPADLPGIIALHTDNWRRDYRGVLPEQSLGAELDLWMATRWNVDRLAIGAHLVARDTSGLIGFAALDPDHPDGVFLDNLHIRQDRRGFGLGRALMATVARFSGRKALWLEVLLGNRRARAIYRHWGGQEGAAFDDPILGVTVPACRVTWPDARALAQRLTAESEV